MTGSGAGTAEVARGAVPPAGSVPAGSVPASEAADGEALDATIVRLAAADSEVDREQLVQHAVERAGDEEAGSSAFLERLKAESERRWASDPHASLRLAEALIVGARWAAQPRHEALGLMAKADALRFLGRYAESLELFEAAARRFQQLGDEVGWARTRIGGLVSMQRVGKGEEALDVVDRARDVLVRHEEWLRAGGLDLNAAVVSRQLGQYDRALALFERAQTIYESLGEGAAHRVAAAMTNRATVLALRGDFDAALQLYAQARDVFARRGATVSLIRNDLNVAYVHADQGRLTQALRLWGEALDRADRSGLEAEAVATAMGMVECYLALNRSTDALELAHETVARAERGGAATQAARARLLAALAEQRLGRLDRALALVDGAESALRRAGMSVEVAATRLQRARLHLAEEDYRSALGAASDAAAEFRARGMTIREAEAWIAEARALAGLDRGEEAVVLAEAALTRTSERGAGWMAHEGHEVLAQVARRRGDVPAALTHCRAAVESLEATGGQLANALRTAYLGDKLEAYQGAVECCLAVGNTEEALAFLERAKSRALVDFLSRTGEVRLRARDAAEQELVDELSRLRAEHNWFYRRLHGGALPAGVDDTPQGAEAAALRARIADRERRIARLVERLALRAEGEPEGVTPRALVERPTLADRTALVEYFFTPNSSVAFVLASGGGGVRAVPLGTDAGEIERLMFRWQLVLEATARALAAGSPLHGLSNNARSILATLYRMLILPVETHLVGQERLAVVPYGATHAVPFHALFDGRRYLIERMEVTVAPSSSVLALCAGRRRRTAAAALVVACSDGGRLPHAVREAETVAALLGGTHYAEGAATRQAVIDAAPRHAVLHLAAHGESRLDRPAFAHVQLADGQLSAADVFNLRLEGTLVTLSACETGRAVVTGGDELVGLSRGFLYAGASALVQSLWRVDDASTARLMELFYEQLRVGQTAGLALRAAQLWLTDETGGHPYLWAPFQLVGDGAWCWRSN